MTRYEIQEKEIETIKGRVFVIELSDADVVRLCKKAGGVGMTAQDVLKNFIGDLVNGTYTNGSDECLYAQQWFERCGFSMFAENTFLRYLLGWDYIERVLDIWDELDFIKGELRYAAEHPEEYEQDEIAGFKEEQEVLNKEIEEIFLYFKDGCQNGEGGTLEQEIERVMSWKEEYDKYLMI